MCFFKKKPQKQNANVPMANKQSGEICCSDKLARAYKLHGINMDTVSVNDPDPEYLYSNDRYTEISWENVYLIKEVAPSDDWEIAKVGIHVRTGKFYRVESRQKSYGAFLGGEDTWTNLSQSDFCTITGRDDINADNALSFVPDELKGIPATKITEQVCSFRGINDKKRKTYNIAYLSVTIERRFGTDIMNLVRYKDGYRAIHKYESHDFPDKKASRHLSETEVSYVIDALPMKKPDNCSRYGTANISIYGGEHVDAFCILDDGEYFYFGSEEYALTIYDRLYSAVKYKLIFNDSSQS